MILEMRKTERQDSLILESSMTFFAQIIFLICGFTTSIILARVLGPSGRGIYALIILVALILQKLGTAGVEISNVYFAAKRKYKLDDLCSNSLVLAFGLSFFFISVFWGVYNTTAFQKFLSSNYVVPGYLWMTVFILPFYMIYVFFRAIFLGREKIEKYNAVNVIYGILQLGLVFLLLVVLAQGLFGAVLSYFLTIIATALFAFLLTIKTARIRPTINFKLVRKSVQYGGKGYLGNIMQFLNYRLDMFLVAYFLTPASVGYYAVSVGIAERLWMFPGSIGTVLFPRISSIKSAQANRLTPKMARHTLLIVFIISLGLLILARPLIRFLFGLEFLPSVGPLIMLLPGIIALSVAKILISDLAGRGKPEFGTLASFISLAVNIPLNIWLIPKWGIFGAAFASTVAYSLAAFVILLSFLKLSRNSWKEVLFIKSNDLQVYYNILLKVIGKVGLNRLNKRG